MLIASGFSWFHLFPPVSENTLLGPFQHHTYHLVGAWFACAIIVVGAVVGRMGLEKAKARQGIQKYAADASLTPRTAAELLVGGLQGMMSDVLSKKDTAAYLWLIGGLFTYILVCNSMALVPGFQPPTDNINTNVGMAITVFLVFNFVGFSRDAVGYVKHLFGPVIFIAWLIFPIEVVGLFVRPISLSLRLTGNIFGDHTVFNIMSDLVPIGVPMAFLLLATLVSVIQAFVFSLLTAIYLFLSLPHGDHDH